MACLREPMLQGYLEECGASRFRQMVESRLASCARCRASFDRVVATNRRVNAWLSKLSLPTEGVPVDMAGARASLLARIENVAATETRGARRDPRAFAASFVFQGAIVAALMLVGTSQMARTPATQITLIAPAPVAKPLQPTASHGGGGGQRSPLPPLKGELPKPAPRVFVSPLVTIEHPALTMDVSLLAPPDAWALPTGPIGDPLGVFAGGGGPGNHGGIGPGDGSGIGDRTGAGFGGEDVGIFNVGGGIGRPEVISKVDPEYSEEARKAKYSGAVMLSIVVSTDGRATDIKVVKSLGMGLDEKAVEAVQRWRFRPGTYKGAPVRVRAQVEVNFRLL